MAEKKKSVLMNWGNEKYYPDLFCSTLLSILFMQKYLPITFPQIVQNNIKVEITVNMQMTINTEYVTPTAAAASQYYDKALSANRDPWKLLFNHLFPLLVGRGNICNFTQVRVNNRHLSEVVNLTPVW